MQTVFSTQQVHPRDKFDYWHNVACKTIVDHDSRPKQRFGFEAEIQVGSIGSLQLILFSNSPMQIDHGRSHLSRAASDDLFVCRQMTGTIKLEQDGREITLGAGCITLLDPLLPYKGQFLDDSKTLVVRAPRRELEARLGRTRHLLSRLAHSYSATDQITSSVIAMLPSITTEDGVSSKQIIGTTVLDLIALSLAGPDTARPRASTARTLILLNIRSLIEERLADRNLDPQTVAEGVGISVRYANEVLAEQGASLARLILARRLTRCRMALEDPAQAHRTVSEIAYGWGFSNLTHFGRRFKREFGVLPNQVRPKFN